MRPRPDASNIRVLHTIAGLQVDSGGPSRTVPALCEELGRVGVFACLMSQDLDGSRRKFITPDPKYVRTSLVRGSILPSSHILSYPTFKATLKRFCADEGIQIIHDHGAWLPSNHAAASTCRESGIRLIVSPRGMLESWAISYRANKKRLAWMLYQRRDLLGALTFHATSLQEVESIRAMGLRQPIAVIPNGLRFPTLEEKNDSTRIQKSALFLSRIHPKKGLLNLVHAWGEVRPKSWGMIIAGPDEGDHWRLVNSAIRRADLQDVFQYIGPVQDEAKWGLYSQADLFILPTQSENFGVVVAEALASGLPVITTKGAPWGEIARECCGWWVDVGIEPLAKALREATSLPVNVLKEMGERGRRMAAERFSWKDIAGEMHSVYRWMLEGGVAPPCVIAC